ncbi:MAG TPA: hypothetical protein VK796_05790 [Cytophaga sp.]|nr:hypothetical protein [Cytophaga sp.]
MKQLFIILSGLLMCSCTKYDNGKRNNVKYIGDFSFYKGIDTTKTIVIEQYQIDLDFDNQLDSIVLKNLNDLAGDPQIFSIVEIKLASGKEFVIHNVGGYTQDIRTKKKFLNKVKSDKIYIPDINNTENYLIIWDYQYPSCDAYISIFKIKNDDMNQVYNQKFYISEIDDFNNDGKMDFKGKMTCDENEKESMFTIE